MKGHLRQADKTQSRLVAIVGEEELKKQVVALKDMEGVFPQENIPGPQIVKAIEKRLMEDA